MATKRRSSKEILAIIEAAIQKASDEGRDFADTSLDMPGEEVSPLIGYGIEADEIFAENNIRSGTQLGQFIAELKRLAPDQLPITGTTEVSGDVAAPPIASKAGEDEEEMDPNLDEEIKAELLRLWQEGSSLSGETIEQRQRRLRKQAEANVAQRRAAPGIAAPPPGDDASLKEWTPEQVEAGAEQHWEGVLDQAGEDADPVISGSPSSKVSTDPLVGEVADVDPEEEAVAASPAAGKIAVASQQGPPQPPGDLGPGKAEAILGILEVLGGLGGKIAGGRAMRRADKKTEQSQRVANLINALSKGRAGAQATTAQPRMGTGGQVLSALGGVGRMGGRLVDAQKKAKATEYEQSLASYRAETERGRAEASSGRNWDRNIRKGINESYLTMLGGTETPRDAIEARAMQVAHLSPLEQAEAMRDFQSSFQIALEDAKGGYGKLDEKVSPAWTIFEKTMRGDEFKRVWEQGIAKALQEEVVEVEEAISKFYKAAKPPEIESEAVDAFTQRIIGTRRGTGEGLSLHGITTDVMDQFIALEDGTKPERAFAEAFKKGVSETNKPLIDNAIKKYSDLWAHNIKSLQTEAQNAYFAKIAADDAAFLDSGKRSDRINLAIADLDAFAAQVDIKKTELAGTEIRGPLLGRLVPTLQWLHPSSVTYDETLKGFALSVAAALNRGRPSNADFDAAMAMIPKRSDSEEVADMKWASILAQSQAARDALMSQYMVSYNDVFIQMLKDKGLKPGDYLGHSPDADPEVILELRAEALKKYKEGLTAYQGSTVYSESDMKFMQQRQGAKRYGSTDTASDALTDDAISGGGEATTEDPESGALSKEDEAKVREYQNKHGVSREEAEKHVLKNKW